MLCVLDFIFLNLAFTLFLIGLVMNTVEDYLPLFIKKNFRYGKFGYVGESKGILILPELPKSYFRHFYLSSTTLLTITLPFVVNLYSNKSAAPSWLVSFLDLWCGSNRIPTISPAATVLSLTLIAIQCYKRLYETFFLQVFAKTAKINISHYIVGNFHYYGCVIAILGHSVGFTSSQSYENEHLIDMSTLLMAMPAISLFFFAWINQFRSNKILANLRKDDSKKVVSQKYFLPKGGWFEYISSPHLLCEILIYISLTLLLAKNTSWLCVLAWVISNQTETAILSHQWYRKTFPKLPKQRKALIPQVL